MDDPLKSSISQLEATLRSELASLQQIQEGRERSRQKLLDDLLQQQAEDIDSRRRDSSWRKKFIWAPLALLLGGGGTAAGWAQFQVLGEPPLPRAGPCTAQDKLQGIEDELRLRHLVDARIVEMIMDQRILVSESVFYLGGKIDLINGRSKRLGVPDAVQAARLQSWKIQQSRTPFSGYSATNPLGDILKESKYGAQ